MYTTMIPIDQIRTDGNTQMRVAMQPDVIDDYAAAMRAGTSFPPLVVFFDTKYYWLADGFHRLAALKLIGDPARCVMCEVREGSQRQAMLYACGVNANHGLRRGRADVQNAIDTMLYDEEWETLSDREIARLVGCSHPTVAARRKIIAAGKVYQQPIFIPTQHAFGMWIVPSGRGQFWGIAREDPQSRWMVVLLHTGAVVASLWSEPQAMRIKTDLDHATDTWRYLTDLHFPAYQSGILKDVLHKHGITPGYIEPAPQRGKPLMDLIIKNPCHGCGKEAVTEAHGGALCAKCAEGYERALKEQERNKPLIERLYPEGTFRPNDLWSELCLRNQSPPLAKSPVLHDLTTLCNDPAFLAAETRIMLNLIREMLIRC